MEFRSISQKDLLSVFNVTSNSAVKGRVHKCRTWRLTTSWSGPQEWKVSCQWTYSRRKRAKCTAWIVKRSKLHANVLKAAVRRLGILLKAQILLIQSLKLTVRLGWLGLLATNYSHNFNSKLARMTSSHINHLVLMSLTQLSKIAIRMQYKMSKFKYAFHSS